VERIMDIEPPSKYEESHKHLFLASEYFAESVLIFEEISRDGSLSGDVEEIKYATDLTKKASKEINIATDLLDKAGPPEKEEAVTPTPTATQTVSPTPTPTPTVTATPSPTVTSTPEKEEDVDRGCIIATSTYGSELTPEVQFLRGFRENTVYSTFAGTSFMAVFNSFYYSWSPSVAGQIWQSESLQSIGRVLISPLLGILHVSTMVNSILSFNPEIGIVMTGLVAAFLIGAVYFTPPTLIPLYALKRRKKALPKAKQLRPLLIPWAVSLVLIYLGGILASPLLTMGATGTFVVFTIALVAGAISLKILQR